MAGDVTQKLKVIIQEHGAKATTAAIEGVTKSYGRINAQQDKHEKGSAAMGKNSTANFAKMSQGLGGLVHVYATVAANVFALSSAFSVLSNAADVEIMVSAAEQLSQSTGISYANVAQNMKQVTQGALSMEEALRSASIGISSGLSGKQMQQITEIATKAANALGRSVPEAINRMTQAVVKNEPELVDEYGIILRVDSAMKEYAATLGKTKSELTSYDKQMAIHAQLVNQGEQKFGGVDAQVNSYNKLSASFSEMTVSVLEFMNKGLSPLVNLFAENRGLLAAVAAIFAKGIFNKAIPELKNYTNSLKENQNVLQDQLDNKIADIAIQSAPEFSYDIAKKGDGVLLNSLSSMAEDKDFGGIGDSITDQINEGFHKGIASKDWSTKDFVTKDFKKEFKELSKAADDALASGSSTVSINNKDVEITKVRKLIETYKVLTDTKHKDQALSSREGGIIDRNINKLKLKTAELEKQRIIRKQAVNLALQEGFAGNSGLAAKEFVRNNIPDAGVLTKGYVKVAGAFGRIMSVVGNIGSLISGWGMALFVVTQAITPVADALGLTSAAAREAQDNIVKADEALQKLDDAASTIDSEEIKDMQGYIDNLTASANNFNEQMDNLTGRFADIAAMQELSVLDKLLNFDLTSTKEAIDSVVSKMEEFHESRGLMVPTGLKTLVTKAVELNRSLDIQKKNREKIREESEKTTLSETEKTEIARRLKTVSEGIANTYKEIAKQQNLITESSAEELQNKRDLTEIAKAASSAAEALAKEQADAQNKFAKSSPYFATLGHLENINKQIIAAEGNQKILQTQADEYALKMGISELTAEQFTKEIAKQTKEYKKLNIEALKGKTKQLKLETQLLNIEKRIKGGDNSAILEEISINEQILQLKTAILITEITRLTKLEAAVKSDAEKVVIQESILYIIQQIDNVATGILNTNEDLQDEYVKQSSELDQQLSIMKSQQDLLNTQLDIAKEYGSITEQYALERLNIEKEIEIHRKNIDKIGVSDASSGEKVAQAAVLMEKIYQLQLKSTNEYSKEQAIMAELLKAKAQSLEHINAQISKYDIYIDKANDLADRETTTAKQRLAFHTFELAQIKAKYEAELRANRLSIKVLEKKRKATEKKPNKTKVDEEFLGTKYHTDMLILKNKQLETTYQLNSAIYEQELKMFESRKKAMDSFHIFENPQEFIGILGEEFTKISKEFSDSLMSSVDRAADSILRVADTITDTLYDAIEAGENVGQAIWDAVVAVTKDITREITTDIMKEWTRKLLAEQFGIKSEQAKQHEAAQAEREKVAKNTAEIAKSLADGGTVDKNTKEEAMDSTKNSCSCVQKSIADQTDEASKKADEVSKKIEEGTSEGKKGDDSILTSLDKGFGSMIDSFLQSFGITTSMGDSGVLGGIGGALGGVFGGIEGMFTGTPDGVGPMQSGILSTIRNFLPFEQGGITNSLNRYSKGTITDGPEIAMIGDNSSGREAVVPLPSGDAIPVEFTGENNGDTVINTTINISGVDTNNAQSVRQSAAQVALSASRALNRAQVRNG